MLIEADEREIFQDRVCLMPWLKYDVPIHQKPNFNLYKDPKVCDNHHEHWNPYISTMVIDMCTSNDGYRSRVFPIIIQNTNSYP